MSALHDSLRITELGEQVGRLAERLAALAEDVDELRGLMARLLGGGDAPPWQPAPTVRWWELGDAERADAVARLRVWLKDIIVPGYGHLGRQIPWCWQQHPLCLYSLDTLSQLWQLLYLAPKRTGATLTAQQEWQTLILPRYLAQFAAEVKGCEHAAQMNGLVRS